MEILLQCEVVFWWCVDECCDIALSLPSFPSLPSFFLSPSLLPPSFSLPSLPPSPSLLPPSLPPSLPSSLPSSLGCAWLSSVQKHKAIRMTGRVNIVSCDKILLKLLIELRLSKQMLVQTLNVSNFSSCLTVFLPPSLSLSPLPSRAARRRVLS